MNRLHIKLNYFFSVWAYNLSIKLLFPDPGQRFALREGGRTVGAGVVSKVISWGFFPLHYIPCYLPQIRERIISLHINWFCFPSESIQWCGYMKFWGVWNANESFYVRPSWIITKCCEQIGQTNNHAKILSYKCSELLMVHGLITNWYDLNVVIYIFFVIIRLKFPVLSVDEWLHQSNFVIHAPKQ